MKVIFGSDIAYLTKSYKIALIKPKTVVFTPPTRANIKYVSTIPSYLLQYLDHIDILNSQLKYFQSMICRF